MGVNSYLRHNKHSKTFIRKNKKGLLNYWFYSQLNSEVGLGYIYYLNMLFIVLGGAYLVFSVAFGWIGVFELPIAILGLAVCCVEVPATVFESIFSNYEEYGRPFVLWIKRTHSRGYTSSFFDLGWAVGLVAYSVWIIILAL